MAITTDNGKLAVMSLSNVTMPANLPISPGVLGQDDQQQLLWGFPEILWAAGLTFQPAWAAGATVVHGGGQ